MVNFTFSFFETLIQKLVTHCHYYLVRECYILQSPFQNCTCPHRQAGATGCQPSMATSSVSDEASNSLSIMRFPSPGQRWYILMTKDKTTDSEAMHYGIWQERCRLWLEENPVDVPRADEVLSANTDRHPFTWCGGVCKRNGDQPLLLQAGISRRVVEANRPALFRLSSTCLTSLQSQSVNVSSKTRCCCGDQLKFTWIRFCRAPREEPKAMAEHNCPFFLPLKPSRLPKLTTTVQNECELKSAPICSPRRQFGAKLCEYVPLSNHNSRLRSAWNRTHLW